MHKSSPDSRFRARLGFSLVEIVMAIGIVSFALIATLGLLPVGLNVMRESMNQTALANISHQIRGELQQISFDPGTSFNIQQLGSSTYYYTRDGLRTEASDAERFYEATFSLSNGLVGGSAFDPNSAQAVKVTISYPPGAPIAETKKTIFALFAARQSNQ